MDSNYIMSKTLGNINKKEFESLFGFSEIVLNRRVSYGGFSPSYNRRPKAEKPMTKKAKKKAKNRRR